MLVDHMDLRSSFLMRWSAALFFVILAPAAQAQDPPPCGTTLAAVLPTCPGDADGSLTVNDGAGGPYTYTWFHDGTITDATATDLVAGHYSVLVTGEDCADLLEIDLEDPEVAPLGTMNTTNISCPGANDGTVSFVIAQGPYTWQWIDDPNQANTTLTGLGPGTYTVVVNGGTCPSFVSGFLGDPSIAIQGQSTYCATAPPVLTADPQWGFSPDVYLWSTGEISNAIQIEAGTEGIISITVIDTLIGCTLTGQITLTQLIGPDVTLSAPDTLCLRVAGVAETTSAVDSLSWHWGGSDTSSFNQPTIRFTEPYWQPITLQGFDAAGCGGPVAHDSVFVKPRLPALFTAAQVPCTSLLDLRFNSNSDSCAFFIGDSLVLDVCYGGLQLDLRRYLDYEFTFYSTQPDRCDDTASVAITLREEPILFLPNAFSPDGDLINDEWPGAIQIPEDGYELQVFDRWGEAHWHSTDTQERWNGGSLPIGVYVYTMRMRNPCIPTEELTRKGTVALIR